MEWRVNPRKKNTIIRVQFTTRKDWLERWMECSSMGLNLQKIGRKEEK
jgi:hypothetical protein